MDIQFFGFTTKPMSWKNTLNRIKLETDQQNSNDIIVYKNLRMDCSKQECEWKNKPLLDPLTTTEFSNKSNRLINDKIITLKL